MSKTSGSFGAAFLAAGFVVVVGFTCLPLETTKKANVHNKMSLAISNSYVADILN